MCHTTSRKEAFRRLRKGERKQHVPSLLSRSNDLKEQCHEIVQNKKNLPLNKEISKEDRLSICCEITVSILKAQHISYTVIQPNTGKRVLHGVIFSLRRQAQNLVFSRIFYHKVAQIHMAAGRQITVLLLYFFIYLVYINP
jgi:hypothetical protein